MTDHLFPKFHVRPARGYLNDPNGPVVVDGVVHLYFQYRSSLDLAAPVMWGHMTSRDLVHWQAHRPALVAHPEGPDRDGCWSGNTVVDDAGRVRAFYSGLVFGEPLQRTVSAVSDDDGWSFAAPDEIVPAPAPEEGVETLRDPFVWRDTASWRMALGARTQGDLATIRLYASEDLEHWTYQGLLAGLRRTRTGRWDSGSMWECPQVLSIDGTQVAVVGSWSPEDGVMQALSFVTPTAGNGEAIDASALHLVDEGPNFYAASVLTDHHQGTLIWGWATEGRSAEWCQEVGWSGMLSLPRMITLRADGGLASSPVPAMTRLRREPAGRDAGDGLDELGAQFEFLVSCDPAAAGCLAIRIGFGAEECLDIRVEGGTVVIDRSRASADPRAAGGEYVVDGLETSGTIELWGFVDGSILELFLPGGRVATVRFYPTTPPPWSISLDPPEVARLRVWALGPDPSGRTAEASVPR